LQALLTLDSIDSEVYLIAIQSANQRPAYGGVVVNHESSVRHC
jgi:hypothetical protein